MPTINESELRRLVDNLRESIRGGGWSDAIAALESRLLPPHRTVDWPDEPGTWLLNGHEVYVTEVGNDVVWVGSGWKGDGYADATEGGDDPVGEWIGPLTVIVPDKKPEPGPWDYSPQEGDRFYIKSFSGHVVGIDGYPCLGRLRGNVVLVDSLMCLSSDSKLCIKLSQFIAAGYRFAKAEVSPPPESRDAKGGE